MFLYKLEKLPRIVNSYIVERDTVWKIADPYNILIGILEGECSIEVNNKKYHLTKGNAFFIPANQIYERTPINGSVCKILYVHFSTDTPLDEISSKQALIQIANNNSNLINYITDYSLFPSMHLIYLPYHFKATDDNILNIYKTIERQLLKTSLSGFTSLTLNFCVLLSSISAQTCSLLNEKIANTDLFKTAPKMKSILVYIRQNISSQITLDDLCNRFSISKSQISRYFKSAYNKTPIRYITELKINRAKEMLLSDPSISIKSICEELGFNDQHYFSRLFTKLNKETPSNYKYRVHTYTPLKSEITEKS